MKKNTAVAVLALVFTMNLGSGVARQIDHRMFSIESSLYDKLEDRARAECSLERDRKLRSRAPVFLKV
jgi:hypothetical protein